MARAGRKLFHKIGEVCKICDLEPHVLRYWESEFPVLSPSKNRSGQRIYRSQDLELINTISHLLYEEGFTIAGAKKQLSNRTGAAGLPLFKKKNISSRELYLEIQDKLESLAKDLRKEIKT